MKTLKSVLLSTSLLMTAPFAAADVEQRDLPGVQAQSAEALEAAFERYQKSTTGNLLRLLKEVAQVELSTLNLNQDSEILPTMIGLKETLKNLKAKEDKLTAETTSLQTQLATAMGEKDDLVNQLKHAKASITQLEQSNRQAGEHSLAKIRELTDALQKASDKSNALFSECAAAGDRVTALQTELAAKGGGVDNTQLTDAVNRVTELKAQLAAKDEEIQRLQSTSDQASYIKVVRERDDAIAQRDERIEKTKHMEALEQLRTQLKADYAASNNRVIQSLERRLAEAETVLAKERTLFDQDLAAANKKLTDLKAEAEKRESQLKGEVARLRELQVATKTEQIQERDNAIANERELTAAKAQLTAAAKAHARELAAARTELDNNRSELVDLRAANEKLKADSAKRELELKDANEAHARELTAANEAHARELEAANAKLSADAETHARELEKAKTDLSTQAHNFSVENEMLRKKLEALRSALANNGQATADANQPLSDERRAAAEASAAILEALEGKHPAQLYQSGTTFSGTQSVRSYNGENAGAPPTLENMSSLESSPAKTPAKQGTSQARQDTSQATQGTSQARQDTSQAPATPPRQSIYDRASGLPPFNTDDSDNRSPSQLPASPPAAVGKVEVANTTQSQGESSLVVAAAATGEDPRATQIATLQADLAAAQAIVDKPDLPVVPVPGKNAKLSTRTNYDQYVKDSEQLAQDKAAAEKDVKRLTAELAALQQQPAGN